MCNKKKDDFVHLHCHTHYSLQDALPSETALANAARDRGQEAVAITDHGKMGGVIEFVKACRGKSSEEAIKPIIGCELYMCPDHTVKEQVMRDDGNGGLKKGRPKHWHLTTLAQNQTGYRNLMNLASIAEEDGYYYDPRSDWNLLDKHGDGLILLSGCLASEFNQALLKENYDEAKAVAKRFKDRFGENYYIEVQYHGIPEQKMILPHQIAIAEELDIPLVATNDVHYVNALDWQLHDIHIQMRNINDENMKANGKKEAYSTHQFYLKSQEEMSKMFGKLGNAMSNTLEIAGKVDDFLNLNVPHLLPRAMVPEDNEQFNLFRAKYYPYHQPHEAYLAFLAHTGLHKLGKGNDPVYKARLKTELDQIMYMGVSDYFLIQREMVEFMRGEDIWYGIRGSGVGSLVNYCLKISSADPVVWNLMFQRFLNPGRGTQYRIDFKEHPYKQWFAENGKQDQFEPTKRIKEICRAKVTEDKSLMEHSSKIAKEIWILENQGLSAYLMDLVDSGVSAKHNDSQLWVAYCLGIAPKPESDLIVSSVAPLPDVDSDIAPTGREDVIEWARNRFGRDKVCQIGTYNKYGAKAALTGVLKTSDQFRSKYADKTHIMAQYISKMIPFNESNLDEAVKASPELEQYSNKFSDQFGVAKKMIGTINSIGVHAGGVLISSEPIKDHSPMIYATSKKCMCSAYDMHSLEHVGLTKYDLLGVDSYDMLSYAIKLIKDRRGEDIDLDNINLDDPRIFNLYAQGKTSATFQFASGGMQDALKKVHASNMEDLIAVVALFRPGPMAYIDQYAEGKKNPGKIVYSHPVIKQHLEVTYGIPVYQEQAMFIAKDLAGFDWDEVDKMRKAVSKKDPELFAKVNKLFREKAEARDVPTKVIDDILTKLEKFAGYAFNRSHACGYALLSYKTAYLRTYYAPEWLAACMHIKRDNPDALAIYRREAKNEGVVIIEADINRSKSNTYVTKEGAIVLPISTVKGVGDSGSELLSYAPFENFRDMIMRARPNRGMVEHLMEGRALRSLTDISGKTTEQVMELLDELVAERKVNERYEAKLAKQKYKSTADSLFTDENGTTIPSDKLYTDSDGTVVVQRDKLKEKKPLPKLSGLMSKKLSNKDLF